jgi:hypothetical protein
MTIIVSTPATAGGPHAMSPADSAEPNVGYASDASTTHTSPPTIKLDGYPAAA